MQRKFYFFHRHPISILPLVAALGPANARAFEAGCIERGWTHRAVTEAEALAATQMLGGVACGAYTVATGQDEDQLRKQAVANTTLIAEICGLFVIEEPTMLEEPRVLLHA